MCKVNVFWARLDIHVVCSIVDWKQANGKTVGVSSLTQSLPTCILSSSGVRQDWISTPCPVIGLPSLYAREDVLNESCNPPRRESSEFVLGERVLSRGTHSRVIWGIVQSFTKYLNASSLGDPSGNLCGIVGDSRPP